MRCSCVGVGHQMSQVSLSVSLSCSDSASCSYLCASDVSKQYNLVLAQCGLQLGRRVKGFSTTMRYINRHYLSIYLSNAGLAKCNSSLVPGS